MKRPQKGQAGRTLLYLLSLFVAVSMICGTVLVLLPERRARPTPTPIRPTATSVPASPSPVPPMATPAAGTAAPSPLPQPTS